MGEVELGARERYIGRLRRKERGGAGTGKTVEIQARFTVHDSQEGEREGGKERKRERERERERGRGRAEKIDRVRER